MSKRTFLHMNIVVAYSRSVKGFPHSSQHMTHTPSVCATRLRHAPTGESFVLRGSDWRGFLRSLLPPRLNSSLV
jgi:hypothetical protein